jgi:hypothetical protein
MGTVWVGGVRTEIGGGQGNDGMDREGREGGVWMERVERGDKGR